MGAAYGYAVTEEANYQQYRAWLWTSNMTFPGVIGVFSVFVDYDNKLSGAVQGSSTIDNRYMTITKKCLIYTLISIGISEIV